MSGLAREIRDLLQHQSKLMGEMLELLRAAPRLVDETVAGGPLTVLVPSEPVEGLSQDEYELELKRLDTLKGQLTPGEWKRRQKALNLARKRGLQSSRRAG